MRGLFTLRAAEFEFCIAGRFLVGKLHPCPSHWSKATDDESGLLVEGGRLSPAPNRVAFLKIAFTLSRFCREALLELQEFRLLREN